MERLWIGLLALAGSMMVIALMLTDDTDLVSVV